MDARAINTRGPPPPAFGVAVDVQACKPEPDAAHFQNFIFERHVDLGTRNRAKVIGAAFLLLLRCRPALGVNSATGTLSVPRAVA